MTGAALRKSAHAAPWCAVLLAAAGLQSGLSLAAAAPFADACTPGDGLHYVCGPVASEDLVQVPGTHWLIASSLNVGQPARLWRVDTRSHRAAALDMKGLSASRAARPARGASGCSGPPDPARLSTDGLALRPGQRGLHRLYAANHGDRNAIEIFELDARGPLPALRWVDCAPMPPGTLPNAVTPLPDGGLLVVSFHDPEDPRPGRRWHAARTRAASSPGMRARASAICPEARCPAATASR